MRVLDKKDVRLYPNNGSLCRRRCQARTPVQSILHLKTDTLISNPNPSPNEPSLEALYPPEAMKEDSNENEESFIMVDIIIDF